MKKILALILALVMIMSLAACGKTPAEDPGVVDPGNEPAAPGEGPEMDMPAVMPEVSDTDLPEIELPATSTDIPDTDNKPLSILNTVWATYGEDEKFAAMGGDYSNNVMDAPGACSLSDAEGLDALFGLPASAVSSVNAAASLMHMMNANTFTSACYELAEGADSAAFVQSVKENILARQWMCGFPEILIIVEVDGCIVSAFGNGEIVNLFKDKLASSFTCTVLVEEPIA